MWKEKRGTWLGRAASDHGVRSACSLQGFGAMTICLGFPLSWVPPLPGPTSSGSHLSWALPDLGPTCPRVPPVLGPTCPEAHLSQVLPVLCPA